MSLLTGLVGYWECNEGQGSYLLDATGNGHHCPITLGTGTSGAYWPSAGSTVATFDNQPTIQIAGSGGGATNITEQFGDFTACCWFYAKTSGVFARILDKSYSGGFWLGFNGNCGGGVQEGGSPFGIFVPVSNNAWHHIASRRAGTTHSIIVDGGAVQTSNTVSSALCDTTPFNIGQAAGGGSDFDGYLRGISLHRRALFDPEIAQLYNNGQGLPYPFGIRRMGRPLGSRIIVP